MNQFYAELRCLSVAFALWGNRCQSVALTDTNGTVVECKNPLFVLDPESWWHRNKLDAIILGGPDPTRIAWKLRILAEIIHQGHILKNNPARPDEGIWQIRQAVKADPARNKVLIQALREFDKTAQECKSRIRYLLAKLNYFEDARWEPGEREIAKWEANHAASSSA